MSPILRNRRGNVSVEYAFLAGLVGVVAMVFWVLPDAAAYLMVRGGQNMDRGDAVSDRAPIDLDWEPDWAVDPEEAGSAGPPSGGPGDGDPTDGDPTDGGPDDPWTDDPWSEDDAPPEPTKLFESILKPKNNNGHGNNEDGVDISNPSGHTPHGREDTSAPIDDEKK